MKKITIYIAMALSYLNFRVYAQQFKALQIGQKIPSAIWTQQMPIINSKQPTVDSLSLAHYKGKLIILDFWASWCTNCIYAFDKLEKLQQQYRDQIQILLVNERRSKDSLQRIDKALSKSSLISIYRDTVLGQLFPHSFLPHYVWIGPNGQLLAITDSNSVNKKNLKGLLATLPKETTIQNSKQDQP